MKIGQKVYARKLDTTKRKCYPDYPVEIYPC